MWNHFKPPGIYVNGFLEEEVEGRQKIIWIKYDGNVFKFHENFKSKTLYDLKHKKHEENYPTAYHNSIA